jgi:hypothetical protein
LAYVGNQIIRILRVAAYESGKREAEANEEKARDEEEHTVQNKMRREQGDEGCIALAECLFQYGNLPKWSVERGEGTLTAPAKPIRLTTRKKIR